MHRRARLLGNLLIYTRSFRDADGNVITVDTGQSLSVARILQQQLGNYRSLLACRVLLAAGGACRRGPDAACADAGGNR